MIAASAPDPERAAVRRLLAAGTPHRQIADELGLDLERVAWHARRIRRGGPLLLEPPSPLAATAYVPRFLPDVAAVRTLLAETGPLSAGQIGANLDLEPERLGPVLRSGVRAGLLRRLPGAYALPAATVAPAATLAAPPSRC